MLIYSSTEWTHLPLVHVMLLWSGSSVFYCFPLIYTAGHGVVTVDTPPKTSATKYYISRLSVCTVAVFVWFNDSTVCNSHIDVSLTPLLPPPAAPDLLSESLVSDWQTHDCVLHFYWTFKKKKNVCLCRRWKMASIRSEIGWWCRLQFNKVSLPKQNTASKERMFLL